MKGWIRTILRKYIGTMNTLRYAVEWPRIEYALEFVGPVGRMLDGGAGSGEYTRRVMKGKWAKEVICYEPFDANCTILRETVAHLGAGVTVKNQGIEKLSEGDNSIDAIMCSQVLEHIENDAAVVNEFARVLKPGGHAIICVPRPPAPWPENDHVRQGYTEDTLDELFLERGFRRVHTDWYITRETKAKCIAASKRHTRGVPTLILSRPRELSESREERRAKEPYGLLAVYLRIDR